MKTFILLFVILIAHEAFGQEDQQKSITFGQEVQQKNITIKPKAWSPVQNCNCQCDSYTWSSGTNIKGNCRSQDNNGALFCYISGSAVKACRDVQASTTVRDISGNPRYYSYEACATPPRNQCNNNPRLLASQNYGEGDISIIAQQGQGGQGGQGGLLGLLGGQFGGQGGQGGLLGGQFGGQGINGLNLGNGLHGANGVNGGHGGHGRPTERPVYINIDVRKSGGSSDSLEYTGPNDVGA